jgi:Sulfotransferase family
MSNPARVLEIALAQSPERVEGFHVDAPKPDEATFGHELTISGWTVGLGEPADLVEIVYQGEIIGRARLEEERQDVLAEHPQAVDPGVGWATKVSLVGLPREFELFVRAVFADGFRARLATIRGERRRLLQGGESGLQPLIVSTYGRTGSTWLMRLLDQHPAILAYRPFEYEPRAVSYWTEILGTLSAPASYLQPLATNLSSENWWLGGESVPMDLPPPDQQVEAELAQVGPEKIAALCKERITGFYEAVAASQKKPQPQYFAEKVAPDPAIWRLTTELFPATQEVILVRDFRDMACSILAYNQKTKVTSFGREKVETDLEFLTELRAAAENLLHLHRRRGDAAFLLRYEDLILEPHGTLLELFGFLGVSSSDETIQAVLERASSETEAMAGHRTSGDPRQSVGRWQRDLDPELQRECVEVLDDVLVEFGYEATAHAIG